MYLYLKKLMHTCFFFFFQSGSTSWDPISNQQKEHIVHIALRVFTSSKLIEADVAWRWAWRWTCPSSSPQKANKMQRMTLQEVQRTTHQSTAPQRVLWTWTWRYIIQWHRVETIDARNESERGQFACDFVVSKLMWIARRSQVVHTFARLLHALLFITDRDWSSAASFFIRVGFLDGSGLKRIRARRIIGNESLQGRNRRAQPGRLDHFYFFWRSRISHNACASPVYAF